MSTTAAERISALVLGLEALALLLVAGWEVLALLGGDTDDPVSSIALIVLTVLGAAAVAAFAAATGRGQSWGRSGGIVTQLLMLAVAVGALTGPAAAPVFAAVVGIPAAIGMVVLFLAARAAGRRRSDDQTRQ